MTPQFRKGFKAIDPQFGDDEVERLMLVQGDGFAGANGVADFVTFAGQHQAEHRSQFNVIVGKENAL